MKAKRGRVAVILAMLLLLSIPRLVGIDRFATVDEPYWLTAGSDFYYALGQRDFASTVYDYHPAVTTMWVVAGAMHAYFPQYRGLGQGYYDVYKDSLERFLLSHGRTPLGLLTSARVLQALLIVFLLMIVFWYLERLLGSAIAAVGTLMISFDPFFLGHSRLLNHEAMLSLFVLTSLLALLMHVSSEHRWRFILISGAAAGLAQLTKSSSAVIVPVAALLMLLDVYQQRADSWRTRLRRFAASLGAWLGILILVYVVFWPGMWVAPTRMISEVFGNALSYAFAGSRLSAAGSASTAPFQPKLGELGQWVQTILWRTTPTTWLGAILAIGAAARAGFKTRVVLISVFITGGLFVVLFGLASGRNSAHYVLTSYVALDVLAAAGLTWGAEWLGMRIPAASRTWLPALILGGAVLAHGGSALKFYPYYYTYYSPIMEGSEGGRQNSNAGYGEGLELAAEYLGSKPNAEQYTATVFYGRGCFSYFFPGKTEPLKPIYADAENIPQLRQILHQSDYLVIYYVLEKGRDSPANVMRALQGATPEKIIWLNDIEYVRIYRVAALSSDFYDALKP